jgi:hypothetical protein
MILREHKRTGTLFVSLQLNSPSEPCNIKEMEQTKLA